MDNWFEQESWYQAHRDQIHKVSRSMWLLWLALLGEPVVLVVLVCGFGARLRQTGTMDPSFPLALIRMVFTIVSIATLVVSVVLRRYLVRPPAGNGMASDASSQVPTAVLYRNKATLPAIMATTPAMIGFVLFLLGDSLRVFLGFVLAAVLGLLWHHPNKDELIAFFRRACSPEKPL